MIGGIKTKIDGDYCAYCDKKVDVKNQNFCPVCGNPITEEGISLRNEQIISEKLKLLSDLSRSVKDPATLKIIQNKIQEL